MSPDWPAAASFSAASWLLFAALVKSSHFAQMSGLALVSPVSEPLGKCAGILVAQSAIFCAGATTSAAGPPASTTFLIAAAASLLPLKPSLQIGRAHV